MGSIYIDGIMNTKAKSTINGKNIVKVVIDGKELNLIERLYFSDIGTSARLSVHSLGSAYKLARVGVMIVNGDSGYRNATVFGHHTIVKNESWGHTGWKSENTLGTLNRAYTYTFFIKSATMKNQGAAWAKKDYETSFVEVRYVGGWKASINGGHWRAIGDVMVLNVKDSEGQHLNVGIKMVGDAIRMISHYTTSHGHAYFAATIEPFYMVKL